VRKNEREGGWREVSEKKTEKDRGREREKERVLQKERERKKETENIEVIVSMWSNVCDGGKIELIKGHVSTPAQCSLVSPIKKISSKVFQGSISPRFY
jgi:hypothetical protein